MFRGDHRGWDSLQASGRGTDLSGPYKDDRHRGRGWASWHASRIRHIAVLIIRVNTANHGANVANNKGDIS